MRDDLVLALGRLGAEANGAAGPEEALWCLTRAAPALLGDPGAALRPDAFREEAAPAVRGACAVFLRMPDGRHHLVAAPVNFPPEQYHERVAIGLGHPGKVAHTKRPLLLHDTALHQGFVKILQSFRAGSSMFAPLLWRGDYLGVMICANAARGTFGERDLVGLQALAALGSACFVAQGGMAWLAGLDLTGRPVRETAS